MWKARPVRLDKSAKLMGLPYPIPHLARLTGR
jgi:hypothetical protein